MAPQTGARQVGLLAGFKGDWRDYRELPRSEKRASKRRGDPKKKIEDPRTKRGIIGAFCRAYDVEDAIAEFLPEVYAPSEGPGSDVRYTYVGGSTANGAVVYDDQWLYSNHATDPASDRLVNAFDLVRIHLFGELDEGKDEDTRPASLPSFKAMVEHVQNDPEVLAEFNPDLAHMFDDLDVDEAEPAKRGPLEFMNAQHAIARIGGKTVALTFNDDGSVCYGTLADLNIFYGNSPMPTPRGEEPMSAWWNKQKGRRTYPNGVVFLPGGSRAGAYNLWTGYAVKPDPNASCALFLAHLRDIVCSGNETEFHYVMGWFAHMIQRPDEKPGVALVLRGVKGAGKDTVGDYVGALFPRHRVKVSKMDHLTGRFNAHQEQALLLHVEEGFWAGDPREVGALNRLITADTVSIERKGIDVIEMPSVVRLFISSNEEWVVPATVGERRYAVFDVRPDHARDTPYFTALWHECDNGGLGALLHHLQSFNLADFDVRQAPQTTGLTNQKLAGLKNVYAWWFDVASEERIAPMQFEDQESDWRAGGVIVSKADLYRTYCDWVKARRHHGDLLSRETFTKKLHEMCPGIRPCRPRDGKDRVCSYDIPALSECRAAFAHWLGATPPWGDDAV